MIDHTHYIPILRRRDAEVVALTNLLKEDLANVTPLFELCEHILKPEARKKLLSVDPYDYFYEVIKELAGSCGTKPYFIDFGYVEGLFAPKVGKHIIDIYFELIEIQYARGSFPVPVTGLSRSALHQNSINGVIKRLRTGLCLRVTQREIREATFSLRLSMLLNQFNLEPNDIDLLVDLREYRESNPTYEEICDRIPMLNQWKSFIVASGAFPADLSDLAKNDEHELPRNDWQRWNEAIRSGEPLKRIPTFADYTIQFPKPPEPLNYNPRTSASIRYTAQDHWVVMRGEWLNNPNGAKYDQYWGLANSLLDRPEYSGDDFSFGDQYIAKIGRQTKQTGSIVTWLQAGLNRHMTLTVRQISAAVATASTGQQSLRPLRRYPIQSVWNKKRLILPDSYRQQYLFAPE